MKSKLIRITEVNLWKGICLFSLPLIASNMLQVLFNMSDIAVVGRFAGPQALGEVGSTAILVSLFTGFLIGVGSGVNSVVAKFFGAKSELDVRESVHSSLTVSLAIGFFLSALGIIFSRSILELINTKPEFLDGATEYLHIVFAGLPALAIFNFGNGVWSAVGNTKKPLFFLTVAGVTNVCLNLFFVICLKWDVAGVAVATITAQYISAGMILISLFRVKDSFGLRFRYMRATKSKVMRILGISIPAGLQNAIFGIANLFVQRGVNTFPALTVEGNSAATNADSIVYNIMAAPYVACTSFVAQNYGAGKKKRILESFLISVLYSFLAGAVCGGLLIVFGRPFLSVFTTSSAVIDEGMKRLGIMGFSYAVSAIMDCTISASRGLGRSAVPTVIVILGSCVFRVVWIYTVFAYFKTIPSLYLLYVFSWTITGVAEIIYFIVAYKKETAKISLLP